MTLTKTPPEIHNNKAVSSIKILMVDDLPENLYALNVILKNENFQCIKASSGKQALEIL